MNRKKIIKKVHIADNRRKTSLISNEEASRKSREDIQHPDEETQNQYDEYSESHLDNFMALGPKIESIDELGIEYSDHYTP